LGIKLLVSAIASILILGSIGIVPQSYAGGVDIPPSAWDRNDNCAVTQSFETFGDPGGTTNPGSVVAGGVCIDGNLNTDSALNDFFCEETVSNSAESPPLTVVGLACHIHVPNFDDPMNTKLIRINVHWSGPVQPVTDNVKPSPGATSEDCIRGPLVVVNADGSQGDGHFYEDWTCHPNPDNERIWFSLDTRTSLTRVLVDSISLDRIVVAGSLTPIDTTMVLVAGAQSTSAWMIPVIVAGIGIAVVIARKL